MVLMSALSPLYQYSATQRMSAIAESANNASKPMVYALWGLENGLICRRFRESKVDLW